MHITEWVEEYGWGGQSHLAAAIGKPVSTINRIVSGKTRNVSTRTLKLIAEATGGLVSQTEDIEPSTERYRWQAKSARRAKKGNGEP